MCILKCLSYYYNHYIYKNDNINYNDDKYNHDKINYFKNIDGKEDKWIKFRKTEGVCTSCYKYSGLLAIQDINSDKMICYRCFTDYTD